MPLEDEISGIVEIIYTDSDLSLWVLPNREMYGDMVQETSSSNSKSVRKVIRIKPEAISLEEYLDVIDTSNPPFVERARLKIASITEGQMANLYCYSTNKTKGILICRVTMNGINLSEALLSEGFSKFHSEPGMTPDIKARLKNAERLAKNSKSGVWRPMYGLFREHR